MAQLPRITPRGARKAAVAAALAATGLAAPAWAQTTTGNLNTSATVTENCTLTTTAVAFGNVDTTSALNVDATGGISVTCTSGLPWAASADKGAETTASLTVRKMKDSGTNLLNYALYTDSGRTTVWGDGVGGTTATISDTGSGAAQAKTIYARVPGGQSTVPAGAYSDTVVVTVTY